MILLHLDLLGGFAWRDGDGAALPLPSRKAQALLAYLVANAARPPTRERLAGLFWGDRAEAQARADLRKTLSRLRQGLPRAARACLVIDAARIAVECGPLEADLLRFDRLAAEVMPESLEAAAALYRGELLAGLATCGEAFDAWLLVERRRLDETFQAVLGRLLEHYTVTGAIDRAIQTALRLLTLDPLQEGVHRTLIRLYMYQDRIGAALDQYRRCREGLAAELGVEPTPETEGLKAELLRLLPGPARTPAREADDLPERQALIGNAARQRARHRDALAGLPSLAVLPFAPGGSTPRHLGDGLAEDITTELGRFRELLVIAPASARACRGATPEQAGAALGVAHVLSGSLRPLGRRLRVTAQLVETATGRQLWAERFDAAGAELLDLQDEMVRRITGTLAGHIAAARLDANRRRRPADWQAYDLWLQGWHALRRADLAAIAEARRLFRQALLRDPTFARAYVGLALAQLSEWACYSWNHWFFPRAEALELARTAVALDERDHQARCMLGLTQLYAGDDNAARRELMTALDLNPHDADVLAHVAAAMALLGEHGLAVESARRALRLAPYHPEWYAAFAGIALFAARHYEEAVATMAPAPEALCNTPAFMAASYAHLGRLDQAAAHRATVERHHRRQLARGMFRADMGCIAWLQALDPFRQPADAAHYAEGLRKAGFA